jgi:hypothetical protein
MYPFLCTTKPEGQYFLRMAEIQLHSFLFGGARGPMCARQLKSPTRTGGPTDVRCIVQSTNRCRILYYRFGGNSEQLPNTSR